MYSVNFYGGRDKQPDRLFAPLHFGFDFGLCAEGMSCEILECYKGVLLIETLYFLNPLKNHIFT